MKHDGQLAGIAGLYAMEQDVRGRPPNEPRRERLANAGPLRSIAEARRLI